MRHLILAAHGLWLLWMVGGAVLAVLGFRHHRLWRMPVFRTTHLLAILGTATVPLWNRGVCPLTDWESAVSQEPVRDLLSRVCEWLLYWEAPPVVLSGLSAGVAIMTLAVYIWHPPWRSGQLQTSSVKVGHRRKRPDGPHFGSGSH